jgi:hypothetical protein
MRKKLKRSLHCRESAQRAKFAKLLNTRRQTIPSKIQLDELEELDVQDSLSKFETFFSLFSLLRYLDYEDLTVLLIDIFKLDLKYLENEERYRYKSIKAEILGELEESDDESGSGSDDSEKEGE